MWITPATRTFPTLSPPEQREFTPVICVSASKQIEEGIERRTNGYAYVQGSGDDHELWGMVSFSFRLCGGCAQLRL